MTVMVDAEFDVGRVDKMMGEPFSESLTPRRQSANSMNNVRQRSDIGKNHEEWH